MVSADNSASRTVYPQKADFTFYGGIYRDVYLVIVPKTHFVLDYCGGPAIKVTSEVKGANAEVAVEAWLQSAEDGTPAAIWLRPVLAVAPSHSILMRVSF